MMIGRLISISMKVMLKWLFSRFVLLNIIYIGISMFVVGIILVDSIYISRFLVCLLGWNVIDYVVGMVISSFSSVELIEMMIEFMKCWK